MGTMLHIPMGMTPCALNILPIDRDNACPLADVVPHPTPDVTPQPLMEMTPHTVSTPCCILTVTYVWSLTDTILCPLTDIAPTLMDIASYPLLTETCLTH
jgi:hypothetical protein